MAGRIALRHTFVESRLGVRKQLLAEANRARDRRQDRRAIALYRRILLEEPRNVEVAMRVAPLLASRGETFEAWQLFRMAATELHRARRYDACLGALRDACRCVPNEYEAWRLRAELELKLGREEAAYETLLEGGQWFHRPHAATRAIALLTRARVIEPWDPEVALDLARLYAWTGMVEVALQLLETIASRVTGRTLRRVRAQQWRITLSLRHAWLWLQALCAELRGERDPAALRRGTLLGGRLESGELRGERDPVASVLAPRSARSARDAHRAPSEACVPVDPEVSV
jgi:tetratricopeptide (TPR) repeat protein